MKLKIKDQDPLIAPMKVIQLVESEYGIKITQNTRREEVILPRNLCIYLMHKYCNLTLLGICEYFPIQDHSTVIKSIKRTKSLIQTDFDYFTKLKALDDEIKEYISHKGHVLQAH